MEERGRKRNCEISLNVQRSNNQSENRMWCVSRVPSHSGFTPGVSTKPFPVRGSARSDVLIMRLSYSGECMANGLTNAIRH